jgi:hypothetical protein
MTATPPNEDKPLDKDELRLELGGEYIFAEDLLVDGEWKQYTLTIAKVYPRGTLKTKEGKVIDRNVLEFDRSAKKLVLNKSNERLCKLVIGSNKASAWIGKQITLYAASNVAAFGQKTCAIRIRVPKDMIPYGVRKHLGDDLTGKTI